MRIVHVITRLILGGAQENTLLSCREQAARGHEVVLLTGPETGPEGSLMEMARAMPIRVVLVPAMRRAVRPWSDWVALADLAKNLRDIQPHVVHTHSSKAGILGRRAGRDVGVRGIVHTIHGLAFDAWQPWWRNALYRTAERRAARHTGRLVAVCADMADRAADAGIAPRDAIDVVYSGMDVERFAAGEARRDAVRAEWGAEPDEFVFLKVARLFPLKGHAYVLPAMAEVLRQCPRAMLVLAGEGILRPRIEAEARRLGIADRVHLLGLVPRERIPEALWSADAVVHASVREGLARVLPQAGLCRKPVVSYDIGGAREVVRDGSNGRLLPPPAPGSDPARAAQPLAEAMAGLALDPAGAARMGEAWPPELLRQFDCRVMADRLMEVYAAARRDVPPRAGDEAP